MKRKHLYGILAVIALVVAAGAGFLILRNDSVYMTGQGEGYAQMMRDLATGQEARISGLYAHTGMALAEKALQENDPAAMRDALKTGADAVARQPGNPANWVALGNLYLMAGQFDPMEATEAPVMFTRALEIDPAFIPALLAMGQWHLDKMQFDRSLPHFEKIAEADSAYLSQGWFLSTLTANYILAGKADIGASTLANLPGTDPKRQQAIALLKRESSR